MSALTDYVNELIYQAYTQGDSGNVPSASLVYLTEEQAADFIAGELESGAGEWEELEPCRCSYCVNHAAEQRALRNRKRPKTVGSPFAVIVVHADEIDETPET